MRVQADERCAECGRVFDLWDEDDAQEWFYGHDCEAPCEHDNTDRYLTEYGPVDRCLDCGEDLGEDGPANDDWIAAAYERQHPKPEPDTLIGMVGR